MHVILAPAVILHYHSQDYNKYDIHYPNNFYSINIDMAISFPASPSTNQTYTYNNKIWTYNGTRWLTNGGNLTATNSTIVPIVAGNTVPGATTTGSIWIDTDSGALSVYVGGAWVLPSAGTINLADGAVTTNAFANSSVTTAKIADGAVTAVKLAAGAAVPSQTGQSGKFLTTNGTSASWSTVDALPAQATNTGKYLTTNGTTASWVTLTTTPDPNSITATMLNTTAKARQVGFSLIFGA